MVQSNSIGSVRPYNLKNDKIQANQQYSQADLWFKSTICKRRLLITGKCKRRLNYPHGQRNMKPNMKNSTPMILEKSKIWENRNYFTGMETQNGVQERFLQIQHHIFRKKLTLSRRDSKEWLQIKHICHKLVQKTYTERYSLRLKECQ